MKTYAFTTLAVGEPYLTNSLETYASMSLLSTAKFNITTDKPSSTDNNTTINKISLDRYDDGKPGFSFFVNLKVLSLKPLTKSELDYVIYIDGDWKLHTGFSEDKMQSLFEYMEKNNLDFLFERPALIGGHKQNITECFFSDKIRDYNVMEHTKWDGAHVANEQFLVFKNNWKFRYFVQRWEMFLWYSIHNNIRNYAEGFEIGVSALEAEMKYDYYGFKSYITECFKFYSKSGDLHIRF